MRRNWAGPGLCAAGGVICLGAAAVWCSFLERGGWLDRLGVSAAMLVFAALAVLLLRAENVARNRLLVMLLPIGAAILARALCMDAVSSDYNSFLGGWYLDFYWNGGFKAIAMDIGNYNVPYMYFMAAISYIPVPDLYLIKLFSILFDVILAWGGFRLVRAVCRETRKEDGLAPLAAFAVLLLLPTVVLNSAYWAQCDAIYGGLVLHAVAQALAGKNKSSVALLAVAFSFKLQTVFVLPLWGLLWFTRRVKFRQLLVFPGVYFLTIVPALLLGKPLGDILGVYLGQMGEYPRLTLNAPSMFQYFPSGMESGGNWYGQAGIAAAAVVVIVLLIAGVRLGRRLDRRALLAMAVVLAAAVPWLLPHVHGRYFFLADILSVCLACVCLRAIPAAALICGTSLASYRVFLRLKFNCYLTIGGVSYGMPIEATFMLAGVICAAVVLVQELRRCAGTERKKGGARLC